MSNKNSAYIKVEILDIIMGFSFCLSKGAPEESWQGQLWSKLEKDKSYFKILMSHANEDIAVFARNIVEELYKIQAAF